MRVEERGERKLGDMATAGLCAGVVARFICGRHEFYHMGSFIAAYDNANFEQAKLMLAEQHPEYAYRVLS